MLLLGSFGDSFFFFGGAWSSRIEDTVDNFFSFSLKKEEEKKKRYLSNWIEFDGPCKRTKWSQFSFSIISFFLSFLTLAFSLHFLRSFLCSPETDGWMDICDLYHDPKISLTTPRTDWLDWRAAEGPKRSHEMRVIEANWEIERETHEWMQALYDINV